VRTILILTTFLLGIFPALAAAQSLKIGYVNVSYLIDKSPQAQDASAKLEKKFGPKQQNLQNEQQQYQKLQQKLQKDGLVMSDDKREKMQEKLRQMKRDMQHDQQAFREELNIQRNDAFKGVRKAVLQAVQDLAKEQNYDLIVGQGALYASDAVNLTQRVLDRMKKHYQESGKSD